MSKPITSKCTAENSQLTALSQAEPSLTQLSRKAVTEQKYTTKSKKIDFFSMNLYQVLRKSNIVCYKVQEFFNNWPKNHKGAFLGRMCFLNFAPYIRTFGITLKYHLPLEKAQTFARMSI